MERCLIFGCVIRKRNKKCEYEPTAQRWNALVARDREGEIHLSLCASGKKTKNTGIGFCLCDIVSFLRGVRGDATDYGRIWT